jgi:hypothetical protein
MPYLTHEGENPVWKNIRAHRPCILNPDNSSARIRDVLYGSGMGHDMRVRSLSFLEGEIVPVNWEFAKAIVEHNKVERHLPEQPYADLGFLKKMQKETDQNLPEAIRGH